MIHSHNRQKGFTLVELLFSIAFLTFIMLFIITTIVQVMQTYNKGLAVKEISQTARTTLDDMSRVARSTPYAAIKVIPVARRACFGGVSYFWNLRGETVNRFTDGQRITLARVNDLGGNMCNLNALGTYPSPLRAQSTPLLTDRVWVHMVGVRPSVGSHIADLQLQLSTADSAGTAIDLSGPSPVCRGGKTGEFCAVADFTTTVALKVR